MNKNFKKTIHYLLVLIFSRITLYGQNSNSWSYFYNKKVTLVGFKDSKGIVQIKPKFATMTPAVIFDDIMAAMEEKNGKPIISPNRCYYFGL